jgi:hypothetical protein
MNVNARFKLTGPAADLVWKAIEELRRSEDFHSREGDEVVSALRTLTIAGAKQVLRDAR